MANATLKNEQILPVVVLFFCVVCSQPTLSQQRKGAQCFSCCTVDSSWCTAPKAEPFDCAHSQLGLTTAAVPVHDPVTIREGDLYDCINDHSLTFPDVQGVRVTLRLLGTDQCRPHDWHATNSTCRIRLTAHRNFVFSRILVGEVNVTRSLVAAVGFWLLDYDGLDVLGDTYGDLNSSEVQFYPARDVQPVMHTDLTLVISREVIGDVAISLLLETASNPHAADHLQAFCYASNKGYIQTSNWNGRNKYVTNLKSCVTIVVPENHVIMVSLVGLDIKTTGNDVDNLTLYAEPGCPSDGKKIVDMRDLDPTVYDKTGAISLLFSSNVGPGRSGFRLLYSFHPKTSKPERSEIGTWNCSVPYFSHFRQHFMCSAKVFCSGVQTARERTDCVTEELCGVTSSVRQWELGGHCYRLFNPLESHSWTQASQKCASLQGHLVDLNSEAKRTLFLNMSKFIRSEVVFVGFNLFAENKEMYKFTRTWSDKTLAVFLGPSGNVSDQERTCGAILLLTPHEPFGVPCDIAQQASFVCEDSTGHGGSEEHPGSSYSNDSLISGESTVPALPAPTPPATTRVSMVTCDLGQMAPDFLACDVDMNCSSVDYASSSACAKRSFSVEVPFFTCRSMLKLVPFPMVCDIRIDCCDMSDEDFCHFPACRENEFACADGKQCIPIHMRCDTHSDCFDLSDEFGCKYQLIRVDNTSKGVPPPARVDFTGRGDFVVKALNSTSSCPETHFLCPGNDTYCMPIYVRCNQVFDCPGKEDEMDCDSFACPGFYRCRFSRICVHHEHLCDGVFQCPRHDDELWCNFACPDSCTCFGLAFICTGEFPAGLYPNLRYLDASDTRLTLKDVTSNTFLIHLQLRRCGITTIGAVDLPNLQTLDLGYNDLKVVTSAELHQLNNLRFLTLAHNPLIYFDDVLSKARPFPYVLEVNIAGMNIPEWNDSFSAVFPNVRILNVSHSGIDKLPKSGFQRLTQLRELDLSECPLHTIYPGVFGNLNLLKIIYTENYKLCCSSVLPAGFNPKDCHAPTDEISSCDALLRSEVFRLFLAVYAMLSLLGNLGSFVYRTFVDKKAHKLGFDVFVTHLCVADFLMGVYLAIIGVADRLYYGDYMWNDSVWRHSAACKVAGFLSLLSSEVSAFIICLITLERFLVIRFPFKNFHSGKYSSHVACVLLWVVGLALAAVPLLPNSQHWDFYGQSGICIPLPITRKEFPGVDYAFGVVVGLNFVLFVMIAVGQLLIYWSIRANTISAKHTSRKSEDLTVAHRLLAVVMTDFMCWFPIGVLGILARLDVPIPGDVNVVMAVFVLPFNSALNPFLYTFNMLMERRRKERLRRRSSKKSSAAYSVARTGVEMMPSTADRAYAKDEAWKLFSAWLDGGVLDTDRVRRRVLDIDHGNHI